LEIADWRSTRDLNDLYREIRALGLETRLAELEAFGFTVIEDALAPELTHELRDAVVGEAEKRLSRKLDAENETGHEGYALVPYLLFKRPVFEQALLNPKPLALITYLLGRSCLLSSMTSHFKGPNGGEIPLHSDSANGMPPTGLSPVSHVANCNYALTDYTREGGALAVVPGSHRYFRQPTRYEVRLDGEHVYPDAVPIEVPAGAAVVWHGNTWHGSFPRDATPGIRINLAMYFCRQHIQPQEAYKANLPPEVLERHGEDSRFATLMGLRTYYGWADEGPDPDRILGPAGRSWHG
jgi:hypothetical protein